MRSSRLKHVKVPSPLLPSAWVGAPQRRHSGSRRIMDLGGPFLVFDSRTAKTVIILQVMYRPLKPCLANLRLGGGGRWS